MVCKQDAEGNLLGGASLQLTAEDGTVTAAWISENGTPYLLPELTPDCIYQLSELKAPADFALAEPIYFRLTGDGMLQLLNITTEADGTSWTVTGVAEELTDGRIVMVDAYLGTGTLATTTTTEETTTTTAEETTTTTMRRTDSGNGEQTPTTTTTAETTTEAVQTTTTTGTAASTTAKRSTAGGGTAGRTTTTRSNGGYSSGSSGGSYYRSTPESAIRQRPATAD